MAAWWLTHRLVYALGEGIERAFRGRNAPNKHAFHVSFRGAHLTGMEGTDKIPILEEVVR